MIIQIETLSLGIHQFNFVIQPKDVHLDNYFSSSNKHNGETDDFTFPIFVHINLEKNERQVLLNSSVETKKNSLCDRCADAFELQILGTYDAVYKYDDRNATIDNEKEDFILLSRDHPLIDLTEDIRQTILVSIPMKNLCNENCLGLCSHCGKNFNMESCLCKNEIIDERWSSLLCLKNN